MKTTLVLLALVAVAASAVIPAQQLNSANCLMCELVVKLAENPADREAHIIEQKFDAECKKVIPIPFVEKRCEAYGNSKIDVIINELEGGTAPEDVCTKLKEC
ncbi:unnamed protein product [Caenorhabditis angaria]|uniref:Saposin B-type domain-containing protein n=1 Tax=Caenorhabditis angaria TaxID=860376 RepID=A0A9P1NBW1_9PELO|nr:unnamed protein product [Caenorhabditis angaria]